MEKMFYESAEMEIIVFSEEDVIATSAFVPGEGEDELPLDKDIYG